MDEQMTAQAGYIEDIEVPVLHTADGPVELTDDEASANDAQNAFTENDPDEGIIKTDIAVSESSLLEVMSMSASEEIIEKKENRQDNRQDNPVANQNGNNDNQSGSSSQKKKKKKKDRWDNDNPDRTKDFHPDAKQAPAGNNANASGMEHHNPAPSDKRPDNNTSSDNISNGNSVEKQGSNSTMSPKAPYEAHREDFTPKADKVSADGEKIKSEPSETVSSKDSENKGFNEPFPKADIKNTLPDSKKDVPETADAEKKDYQTSSPSGYGTTVSEDIAETSTQKDAKEPKNSTPLKEGLIQGEIATITDIDSDSMAYPMSEAAVLLNTTQELIQSVLNSFPEGLSRYAWDMDPKFTISDLKIIEDKLNNGVIPSNVVRRDDTDTHTGNESPIFSGEENRDNSYSNSPFEEKSAPYEDNGHSSTLPSVAPDELKNLISSVITEEINKALSGNVPSDKAVDENTNGSLETAITKSINRASDLIMQKLSSISTAINRIDGENKKAFADIKKAEGKADTSGSKDIKEMIDQSVKNAVKDSVPVTALEISSRDISKCLEIASEISSKQDNLLTKTDISSLNQGGGFDFSPLNEGLSINRRSIEQVASKIDSLTQSVNDNRTDIDLSPAISGIKDTQSTVEALNEKIDGANAEMLELLQRIVDKVSVDPTRTPEYTSMVDKMNAKLEKAEAEIDRRGNAVKNVAKALEEQKHLVADLKQEVFLLKADKESLEEALIRNGREAMKDAPPSPAPVESAEEDEDDEDSYDDFDDEVDTLDIGRKKKKDKGRDKPKKGLFGR